MSDDDDGFVFGDEDESLFGSSETASSDGERRFGSNDTDDGSSGSSDGTTATIAAVLTVVVLVVAGTIAYPLVMDAFDAGGSTDGRVPGGGSRSVSSPATPTEPPVTEIVMTVTEPSATPAPDRAATVETTPRTGTTPVGTTTTGLPSTDRPTAPVEKFPAGEPADGNGTAD